MPDNSKPELRRLAPRTTERVRRLRREATFPEKLVWSRLRAGQLNGAHFRRQHAFGPYILDFYCASRQLAVEIDGVSHEDREDYDADRTQYLVAHGVRVVRFANDEVLRNLDDVVHRIACEIDLNP